MPLYRELGGGDAMKGFEKTYKLSYKEMNQKLHDMGHAHPVSCVDCHDPKTMQLRVTRPGFIHGIQRLASSEASTPYAPSIERWRTAGKAKPYDPNTDATRNEMRSFVCGQCHVEYYCSTADAAHLPVGQGPERRADRGVLERAPSSPTASASSTTSTPRPARRS